MMTDNKGIKLLVKRLNSADTNEVLFTINQIRNSGDPEIIYFLLDLLITNPHKDISKAIIELLNELKNKACTSEIIKALQDDKFSSIKKEILTSCWHSGLDYSDHLAFFVTIFIENDFLVAFEAFTIIESFEREYDTDIIITLIEDLKRNLNGMNEEKRNLLIELVHLLEEKKKAS